MGSDGTILDIKTGKVCIFNKRDLLVTPVLRNADRPSSYNENYAMENGREKEQSKSAEIFENNPLET